MSNFDDIFEGNASRKGQTNQPFDKEAWAEKKQAERQAVYDLADTTAEAVSANGSKFQAYLDVQTRFSRYSATNVLLILAQKPDATQLKDFDGWKDAGASIKRQQKGISILEPGEEYEREDGSIGTSYNVKRVFDISQTTARVDHCFIFQGHFFHFCTIVWNGEVEDNLPDPVAIRLFFRE